MYSAIEQKYIQNKERENKDNQRLAEAFSARSAPTSSVPPKMMWKFDRSLHAKLVCELTLPPSLLLLRYSLIVLR
jgi:hypothetical protein